MLLIVVLSALIAVAGMSMLAWWVVGSPALGRGSDGLDRFLEALRIGLSVLAGVGGLVALFMAYRRQRIGEIAEHREDTKLLHERFTKAVEQLGDDSPAVRLGGVHALATVADDWDNHEDRQMCIDVLCSYLRIPDIPEPSAQDEPDEHAAWLARREVRHTILHTIADHLRPDGSATGWQGHHFDLRGITIDLDLNLQGAQFTENTVLDLRSTVFASDRVDFGGAGFSGGRVTFAQATFSSGKVTFAQTTFSGGQVDFRQATFSGGQVDFRQATFSGGQVDFFGAAFSGGQVDFGLAEFYGGTVSFHGVAFTRGRVYFNSAVFDPIFRFVGRASGSAGVIRGLPPDRLTLIRADQAREGSDPGG